MTAPDPIIADIETLEQLTRQLASAPTSAKGLRVQHDDDGRVKTVLEEVVPFDCAAVASSGNEAIVRLNGHQFTAIPDALRYARASAGFSRALATRPGVAEESRPALVAEADRMDAEVLRIARLPGGHPDDE